jgi:hypothetical protein
VPNLEAALVDDEGTLCAVKYASGTSDKSMENLETTKKQPWWTSRFPSQGGPRHQHVFQGAAIEDLRVCFLWDENQIE